MPQDIEVDLPDGSVGVFPEGTSNEVIEQALSSQFPTQPQPGAQPQPQPDIQQPTDRDRRATGDQVQPGSTPPLPETEPDPLSGVATEINGVSLTGEERQAIAHARTLEDPKEKNRIAARLAARIDRRSGEGNFADQINRSGVGAALRGFTNMFGIGDLAAASGQSLSSDMSFTDALEMQQEFRRGGEEEFPLISAGSEIAGTVIGGAGIAKGVSTLAKGTKLAPAVGSLLGFKQGQTVRNIAKASAIGAAEGAITEGVTEDNAGMGALIGAAGGPAGLALAKTLGVALPVFVRGLQQARLIARPTKEVIQSSGAKGLKILADKIGEPVEDLFRRFQQLKALTGKPPSIAELTNKNASLELRKLLEQSPEATRSAQELAERSLATRAREVGETITGGGARTTKAGLTAARTKQGDELFAASHKDNIPFSPSQITQVLENPDLRKALPATLRNEVDDIIQAAGSGNAITIKGKTLDDIRQVLNERIGAGFKTRFKDLSNQVEDIGRAGSANFAKAMDEFATASQRIEGQALGAGVTRGQTGEFIEGVAQATPTAREAAAGGARTTLRDVASEDLTGAVGLVNKLTTESGLVNRLRQIIPKEELDLIIGTARGQKASIESLGAATPRTQGKSAQDILPTLVNAVVALSPTTSAASKVFSGGRLATAFKRIVSGTVEERILKNLAEDVFDPAKTEDVIQALRRAGASDSDIIGAFVASTGGAATAQQALE